MLHALVQPEPAVTLEEELQSALEDTLWRVQSGPWLEGDLLTTAKAVLYRRGHPRAQVKVSRVGAGLAVDIALPPQTPRIERIVLRM